MLRIWIWTKAYSLISHNFVLHVYIHAIIIINLVFVVQYKIHVFYTIFRKPSISPHNFYSTLYNKRKPLNCSIQFHPYWSCNITTVPFIRFWLWHKARSILLKNLNTRVRKPQSTTCYPQPNSLKWCHFMHYMVLITNPPVLNLIRNTKEIYMGKHVFLLYFNISEFVIHTARLFSGFSFHWNFGHHSTRP